MKFCPKCKNLLLPDHQRRVLKCRVCDYEEQITKNTKYIISGKVNKTSKEIVFIDETKGLNLPTVEVECPKCHNNLAYWWVVQTRRADEPPTTFYKCVKCKYSWRDYK